MNKTSWAFVSFHGLDAPGTRDDTVTVTGDSTTPLTPDKPKENTSTEPETDIDEDSPYAPQISFGTGNGFYARWGASELANEYYLTPDDTVTINVYNEPEGAKVYFTGSNTAIDAYKADPAFDFTAADSGWTEYTDHVTVPFADHYARVGAVMTDAAGKAIKGTFISTNFWELDCDRHIGIYGNPGTYNVRMTDYLNLTGATYTNIWQTYYINVAVDAEVDTPSEDDYDFALSDSEPGYLNELLDTLTGNVTLKYKGICEYYNTWYGTTYTSPVLEGEVSLTLSPTPILKNWYDDSDTIYYPCDIRTGIAYGGNFDTIYYSIGKIGDTTSLEGWTQASYYINIPGDIDAGDVALYTILYDSENEVGYTKEDGSFVIFEKPLIRVP